MQQVLLALLAWSGNHGLNVIKPWKAVSDLLGQLEGERDTETAVKMPQTLPASADSGAEPQGEQRPFWA